VERLPSAPTDAIVAALTPAGRVVAADVPSIEVPARFRDWAEVPAAWAVVPAAWAVVPADRCGRLFVLARARLARP
jgi:hypothetical protein